MSFKPWATPSFVFLLYPLLAKCLLMHVSLVELRLAPATDMLSETLLPLVINLPLAFPPGVTTVPRVTNTRLFVIIWLLRGTFLLLFLGNSWG